MALLMADGFDTYPGVIDGAALSPRWGGVTGTANVVNGPNGRGKTLELVGSGSYLHRGWPSGRSYFGFAVNPNANVASGKLIQFLNSSAYERSTLFLDNGSLYLQMQHTTTRVISSGGAPAGVWTYVELSFDFQTGGSVNFQIRVNGTLTASVNADPHYYNEDIVQMRFTGMGTAGVKLDNVVLMDTTGTSFNGYLGPVAVRAVFAAQDTPQKQFVPLTGTDNFAMLDETPHDGDTSYVSSGASGARDLYRIQGGVVGGAVKAVMPFTRAREADAAGRQIRLVTQSGGTVRVSDNRPLTDAYALQYEVLETNPATGLAWTPAEVDAAEFGFENA